MLKKDTEGVIWLLSLPLQKLSDFLDAVKKAYPGDIERGGTALIKFLVYVLRVNYGKSERIILGYLSVDIICSKKQTLGS